MTKEAIIEKTLRTLNVLPNEKAEEVADFADFIMKKYEDDSLQEGIQKIVEHSTAFNFLNDEEYLYSIKDIKEKY
ncbi:hypothetical protein HDF18_11545 [Mucilaginibacter sp. X5P1]|uniref:hypothetical protein n=1 Tax=Mucilaginibacter sp. X5P1 TaxID=2723088 RepID=UPI00160C252E|nr:hypothetical protein [Mucilaginibacter sp. X5P1]MBB6140551.1 hypothetical protein [Mucilaginibacter sp. X5P1]